MLLAKIWNTPSRSTRNSIKHITCWGMCYSRWAIWIGRSPSISLAIDLAPYQPRTYYQLALALRAKQDEAGEKSALTKALAIDDHLALAHSELGRILLNENRLPEAVTQLNLAIQDNPALEQPYNLLARAYMRLGDADKANAMAKRLTEVRGANHRGTKNLSLGVEENGPAATP